MQHASTMAIPILPTLEEPLTARRSAQVHSQPPQMHMTSQLAMGRPSLQASSTPKMSGEALKARDQTPKANQVPIRAHQTRSITTSLALFQEVVIPEIMQAACWKKPSNVHLMLSARCAAVRRPHGQTSLTLSSTVNSPETQ